MVWRDWLSGLAVANVGLLRAWFIASGYSYFAPALPMGRARVLLVVLWALLGGVLAVLAAWGRGGGARRRVAAVVFVLLLSLPVVWLVRYVFGISIAAPAPVEARLLTAAALIAVVGAVAAVPFLQQAVLRVLPLVVAPAMVVTLSSIAFPPSTYVPAAARPAQAGGHPVLWLLFDELDHALVTGARSGAPPRPAFTRLLGEAFVAGRATVPADDTLLAIPSIFTGRRVVSATSDRSDLNLTFEDGTSPWREVPSMFTKVRDEGYWTAVVGWFHPYCRALPGQFDECAAFPFIPRLDGSGSVMSEVREHVDNVTFGVMWLWSGQPPPASVPLRPLRREQHAEVYRSILDRGQTMAADQPPGLAFVHLPVPHPPGILDIVRPDLGPWDDYAGNVVLADVALGEVRAELERRGQWDRTTLVVSSDHRWRRSPDGDPRVPLIIKLPGAREPMAYTPAVTLMVLHDLLPALVRGDFDDYSAIARYLDARR